ncbi:MAG: radical SAM protein [Clostridia bacterium]|nr:radical SAM protein [Clostridia bacterium]
MLIPEQTPGFYMLKNCNLCPRNCNIDRASQKGYCRAPDNIMLAKASTFFYEEPVVSGKNGTGAIFFSGCTLKCCFCQNKEISQDMKGLTVTDTKFSEILLNLQEKGVDSISLISATPYVLNIIRSIEKIKHKIKIPIVYNTSGYEKTETIKMLKDYIDVYVPDIKYINSGYSKKYSNAEDYFKYCSDAVYEKLSQKPKLIYKDNQTLISGVLIRHLVLPGLYKDSIDILNWIKNLLSTNNFECLISIMSQYTPYHQSNLYPEINRRITGFEYKKVINEANRLELNGYMQERISSKDSYIPDFDFEGII